MDRAEAQWGPAGADAGPSSPEDSVPHEPVWGSMDRHQVVEAEPRGGRLVRPADGGLKRSGAALRERHF